MDYKAAVAIQAELRERLILEDGLSGDIRIVAGADISCTKGDDRLFAAVVLLDAATLEVIEEATYSGRTSIPYIPGLLSFREGPALLQAFGKLRKRPDVVLFDGQGIAHPAGLRPGGPHGSHPGHSRRGVRQDPAHRRRLQEPGVRRGQRSPLVHDGKLIGAVVRTKDRVKPVFVSQGHRVSLERAVEIVLQCARRYRIPEPIRRAHILVNKMRKEETG